jgi:hypothetical protein
MHGTDYAQVIVIFIHSETCFTIYQEEEIMTYILHLENEVLKVRSLNKN